MSRAMLYLFACLISLFLFTSSLIQAKEENVVQSHSDNMGPLWKDVCTQGDISNLPFCNVKLSIKERVEDYVKRIPLEQKTKMMVNTAIGYDPLHIPPYQWWSEGLHGPLEPCVTVTDSSTDSGVDSKETACATSFPCPSALGTTFNNTLFRLIGSAIGREGRAISNVRKHSSSVGDGITYWSPTINLQRDPRWGRNQEVPGEDPLLTSQYAKNFVQGLQQNTLSSGKPIQIAACCKHFIANSLENWMNHTRHNFNAIVSEKDLTEYYLPPFKACIESGAVGVMCSYNSVNGVPMCANKELTKHLLRDEWSFDGYVTSDCEAIRDIKGGHHYAKTLPEAAAYGVNATTDVNCGGIYNNYLMDAIKTGLVTEQTITESFTRLVHVQMRMGLFDRPSSSTADDSSKYDVLGINDIDTKDHQQLAYEAAQQSIVLLKNDDNTLPLKPGIRRLAVIGPHTYSTEAFLSNYHGERCVRPATKSDGAYFGCIDTPFHAIQEANSNGGVDDSITIGERGCDIKGENYDNITHAVSIAKNSDVVILMMGLDGSIENEGLDRTSTTLPKKQEILVRAVLNANRNCILVLVNGGALSLGDLKDKTPAIIDAFYGGQSASKALSDVLFGQYNPSGRLVATMYPPDYVNQMPMTDMSLDSGLGRTHMYYKGNAEYAFGHGLSYSKWDVKFHGMTTIRKRSGNQTLVDDDSTMMIALNISVRNLGPYDGRQTVLLLQQPLASTTDNKGQQQQQRIQQKLVTYQGTRMLKAGEGEILLMNNIPFYKALRMKERELVFIVGGNDSKRQRIRFGDFSVYSKGYDDMKAKTEV